MPAWIPLFSQRFSLLMPAIGTGGVKLDYNQNRRDYGDPFRQDRTSPNSLLSCVTSVAARFDARFSLYDFLYDP
jgi:hypothetical protein